MAVPEWWQWDLAFTFHCETRMEERDLSERGRPSAAYIYLGQAPGEKSARTERIVEDVLIDYAADGHPIGIEIVSPGHVSLDDVHRAFDHLGLPRPEPPELDPLRKRPDLPARRKSIRADPPCALDPAMPRGLLLESGSACAAPLRTDWLLLEATEWL